MRPTLGWVHPRLVAILTLGALLQLGVPAPASAETLVWARQFGTEEYNLATGVATDPSGVYVVGKSSTMTGSNGFLAKYDTGGERLWTRFHFGRPGHEEPLGVAAGPSGVYAIAQIARRRPPYFSLLNRYHRNGALAWSLHLGPNFDMPGIYPAIFDPWAVASDGTGVYVTGDITFRPRDVGAQGVHEAFVAKFSPSGDEAWSHRFAVDSVADGIGIGSAGIAVVGGTPGLRDVSAPGGSDALVRLYTADGQRVWTRQFGTAQADNATTVAVDSTGVYVGGVTGDPTEGFVRKFDPAGQPLWHRRLSSTPPVRVNAAAVAPIGGGIEVAGFGGDLGGAPTPDLEGFVRTYDVNGGVLSTTYLDTQNQTYVTGIATSTDGTFVGGGTEGTFPGEWMHGSMQDAFVARLD